MGRPICSLAEVDIGRAFEEIRKTSNLNRHPCTDRKSALQQKGKNEVAKDEERPWELDGSGGRGKKWWDHGPSQQGRAIAIVSNRNSSV